MVTELKFTDEVFFWYLTAAQLAVCQERTEWSRVLCSPFHCGKTSDNENTDLVWSQVVCCVHNSSHIVNINILCIVRNVNATWVIRSRKMNGQGM